MALRDLKARFVLEAEQAISLLEELKAELDTLSNMAEEAQGDLASMGDSAYDAAARAAGGMKQMEEASRGLGAQFREVRATLGALGAAGLGFANMAANAAIRLEDTVTRLRVLSGEAWPEIRSILEEIEAASGERLTFGDLAKALTTPAVIMRGQVRELRDIIRPISMDLLAMGVNAATFQRIWLRVAQALQTGSISPLTTISEEMPFPLIRGEQALAIAKQMREEYSEMVNARILARALAYNEKLDQYELKAILETNASLIQRLHGAYGNFLEEFGKSAADAKGAFAAFAADVLSFLRRIGAAGPLGSWFTTFSMLLTAVGGTAALAKVAGWIGGMFGLAGGPWLVMFKLLGMTGLAALVIEDIVGGLLGKKSVIIGLLRGLKPYMQDIYENWIVPLARALEPVGDWLDRYLLTPMKEFADAALAWLDQIPQDVQEEAAQRMAETGQEAWGAVGEVMAERMALEQAYATADRLAQEALQEMMKRQTAQAWEFAPTLGESLVGQQPPVILEGIPGPIAPKVYLSPEIVELTRTIQETQERISGEEGTPPQPGLSLTQPQINVTFEGGAIQIGPGFAGLDEETRRRVIDETVDEVAQQLRAQLEEQVR